MSPYDRNQPIDPNIIKALEKLPKVMSNNQDKEVFVRAKARHETGKEHIAVTSHGLQVRDINLIKKALSAPEFVCEDPNNHRRKNYYVKREGKHGYNNRNKGTLLKVVTYVRPDEKEEIVTVFPTNSIKTLKTK